MGMGVDQVKKSTNGDDPFVRVAIIGAGFAGLTLANYLNNYHLDKNGQSQSITTHHEKVEIENDVHYDCLVLESKDQPISIYGTFRLPLHITSDVLEPIQKMRTFKSESEVTSLPNMTQEVNSNSGNKKWLISRPQLLSWLRTNVPIRFAATVEAVRNVSRNSGNKVYFLSILSNSGEISELGPFNLVVLASGFSLESKFNEECCELDCTAIVGDARCFRHAWWDIFGLIRIQKGGAMAMMDAMQLAERIVSYYGREEGGAESMVMWLKKYSPLWRQLQQTEQLQKRRLLQIMFIFIMLILLYIHTNSRSEEEAPDL